MTNSRIRILYWFPRLLAIIFTIFISLFALDVFQEGNNFLQSIGAFLIHLTPTYLVLISLAIGWRWPRIGGLLFIALGILYIIVASDFPVLTYFLISGPLFLIGALFMACCHFRLENSPNE